MRNLRRTLEHITILLLASGCGGSPARQRPTGGGCEGMFQPHTQKVALTEALKAELELCTTKPSCQRVCQLALETTTEIKDCRVEVAEGADGAGADGAGGDGAGADGVDAGTEAAGPKLVVQFSTAASCPGRRPTTAARAVHAIETAGELMARQAELEAMSVGAFADLAAALRTHGAPRALVAAACRSARDEIAHAAACRRLAARFGARPAPVQHVPAATPSLVALALDNAVEGEVRETWGAAVATWQAHTARDPAVRRAMQRIAVDETRHAALATSIGAWVRTRLSASERQRVADARLAAIAELAGAVHAEPPAAAVRELGTPDAPTATRLFGELRARVWS